MARTGVTRYAYTILVGKPLRKRSLGGPNKWEDNIRMDLRRPVMKMEDGRNWPRIVSNGMLSC
jgi:hypothetical protein